MQIRTSNLWILRFAQYDKNFKFKALNFKRPKFKAKFKLFSKFKTINKAKNPKNLRQALNLWILRFAQYDKTSQHNKDFVSMTKI